MKKLVIFDLDGTLLDTVGDLAASCNHVLQACGFPQHPVKEYCFFVGNGITKLMERALPAEARTPERITEMREKFVAYYQTHIHDYTRPYDGIPELLEALGERGIKLAVASNKYDEGTRMLINHFFPSVPFAAVSGQRAGVPVKPDPTIVRDILAATQTNPDEALYVGDSCVDMQTARNAGLKSIGVAWGFRPREELAANGAGHIVDTPEEILKIALL